MALRVERLRRQDPHENFPEPDGDLIEALDYGRRRLVVLTRVSNADDAAEHPTNDAGDPLCVGKESGQCNRTVGEPGDTCWQHSADD